MALDLGGGSDTEGFSVDRIEWRAVVEMRVEQKHDHLHRLMLEL